MISSPSASPSRSASLEARRASKAHLNQGQPRLFPSEPKTLTVQQLRPPLPPQQEEHWQAKDSKSSGHNHRVDHGEIREGSHPDQDRLVIDKYTKEQSSQKRPARSQTNDQLGLEISVDESQEVQPRKKKDHKSDKHHRNSFNSHEARSGQQHLENLVSSQCKGEVTDTLKRASRNSWTKGSPRLPKKYTD
jgi:hypothetical protein